MLSNFTYNVLELKLSAATDVSFLRFVKEMKLIYIVRKPLDRMRSHYKFAVERGYTTESINTALQTNSIYTDVSKYHMQITPYINTFGFKNVKIIFFEDFVSDTEKTMSDVCDFLNISSEKLNLKKTHFNQSKKGKIGSIKYDNPKSLKDYFNKTINFIKRRFSNSNSSNVEISNFMLMICFLCFGFYHDSLF